MTDALKPCPFCDSDDVEALDMEGADALAATRRAITMCAAELARRKTPNTQVQP